MMKNNLRTDKKYLKIELHGGLNNQLQMFLAALRYAKENNYKVIEPFFSSPDTLFSNVYQIKEIKKALQHHHVSICHADIKKNKENNNPKLLTHKELWELSKQFNIKKRKLNAPIIKDDIEKDFRSSLILNKDLKKISDYVLQKMLQISSETKWACVQMRIEEDWFNYSKGKKVPTNEDPVYIPTKRICEKIINTPELKDFKDLFFTVSPTNRYEDPYAGWPTSYKTYDKTHFCKDSFDNSVMAAAIDFEIACSAPVFIGTSRSSFSNAVVRNRYIRGIDKSFLYNLSDNKCHLRHDGGLFPDALEATKEDIFTQ